MSSQRSAIFFRLFVVLGLLAGLITVQPHAARAASFVVNTEIDEIDFDCEDGDCSLRDALLLAADGDSISFNLTTPVTLTLDLGEFTVDKNLTITGPGSAALAIDAGGLLDRRVLDIQPAGPDPISVAISGLTLMGGALLTENGGGILIDNAAVTLTDVTVTANSAVNGGGIYVGATAGNILTLNNCTISNNITLAGEAGLDGGDGGGVYIATGTLTVADTRIRQNHTGNGGPGTNGATFDQPGQAGGRGGHGGGLFIGAGAAATLTRSAILTNTTGLGGAGGTGGPGSDGLDAAVDSGAPGSDGLPGGAGGNGGASGSGAGLYALGPITVTHTRVQGNAILAGGSGDLGGEGGWGGHGGSISDGSIAGAGGFGGDGGVGGAGGASGSGAGLLVAYSGVWTLTQSTISGNTIAGGGRGGNGGAGGVGGWGGNNESVAGGAGGDGGDGGAGGQNGVTGKTGSGAGVYDGGRLVLKNVTISGNTTADNDSNPTPGAGGDGGSGGGDTSGTGQGGNGGNGGNGGDCIVTGADAALGVGLASMGNGESTLENLTLVSNEAGWASQCTSTAQGGLGGVGGGLTGVGGLDGDPGQPAATRGAEGVGGLYVQRRTGAQVKIRNSLVTGNNSFDANTYWGLNANCLQGGAGDPTLTDSGYNLDYHSLNGTTCSFADHAVTTNPDLAELTNQGAYTPVRLPIGFWSPAVDAGSCADLAGNPITTEQRADVPRPVDGDRDMVAACDIGAAEYGVAVWTNGGGTGLWADSANWAQGLVPSPDIPALFNGTTNANANFTWGQNAHSLRITPEYAGAINIGDFSLTTYYDLVQEGGTINLTGGNLTVNGHLNITGGAFNPATSTLGFQGSAPQYLTVTVPTTFNHLQLFMSSLVETGDNDNVTVSDFPGNTLSNSSVQKTRSIRVATNLFGITGASFAVTNEADLGGLSSVTITRTGQAHPQEDISGAGDHFMDMYYRIAPEPSDATGFSGELCLRYTDQDLAWPIDTESSLRLCRWTGTAWTCPNRTLNSNVGTNTVCAAGVTEFSDWTIGQVSPTAIMLNTLEAQTTPDNSAMGWLLMLLGVFTLGGLWLMRKAARD